MDASVFEYREVYYRLQLQGLLNDICGVYALICQSEQHLPDDENKKMFKELEHIAMNSLYEAFLAEKYSELKIRAK